jgi:hypothetical protein
VTGVTYVVGITLTKGKTTSLSVLIAALIFQYIVMFLTIYFIAVARRGADWRTLGFRPFDFIRALGLVVAAYFGAEIINIIYALVLSAAHFTRPPDPALRVVMLFIRSSRAGLALALFMVAVVAPIMEELFFRGFIYAAFRKRWGVTAAITLSSALFAVSHASLYNFIPLMVLGAVLAYLYQRTGSLGPPIMLHALNNFLSVVLIYYYPRV